ncbi:12889_t:CDS:1, partial [Cetraspora pellucida]
MSSSEENTSTFTSVIRKDKKHSGSCSNGSVWDYFTKDEKLGKEIYKTT